MDITLNILALIVAVFGLLGAVVPVIPGAVLSFCALLLSYFTAQSAVSFVELLTLLAVTIVVSVVDAFLPIYLTRRLGGSKSGVWGATIGMVVGFIAFPPFGVFVGPIFGAIMGELMNDKEDVNRALKVGAASFLAFIVGTGAKFTFSLYILSLIISSQAQTIEIILEWGRNVVNL